MKFVLHLTFVVATLTGGITVRSAGADPARHPEQPAPHPAPSPNIPSTPDAPRPTPPTGQERSPAPPTQTNNREKRTGDDVKMPSPPSHRAL